MFIAGGSSFYLGQTNRIDWRKASTKPSHGNEMPRVKICEVEELWRALTKAALFLGFHLCQPLVAMALHQMVVDHADRLHEGIDDGRSDELEAAHGEFLGDFPRQLGLGGHLLGVAELVDLRFAVEEVPQERREARALVGQFEVGPR